ncbi:hypothetical protein KFK09_003643 [Dendrobium nobile]|uniref:Uncharacterized protein n=1 Tax=Dendrobium nobile TaxID=94219 RepID=A0A8T3C3L3_DENNO|nr:hypothetical protein KFK09_003643 [Dendrobium nobile]
MGSAMVASNISVDHLDALARIPFVGGSDCDSLVDVPVWLILSNVFKSRILSRAGESCLRQTDWLDDSMDSSCDLDDELEDEVGALKGSYGLDISRDLGPPFFHGGKRRHCKSRR